MFADDVVVGVELERAVERVERFFLLSARNTELILGDTGPGTGTRSYPKVLNDLLGYKFKLVSGFRSSADVFLAMERGEVDGICESLDSVNQRKPDWIANKTVNVLLQAGAESRPELVLGVDCDGEGRIGALNPGSRGVRSLCVGRDGEEVGRSVLFIPVLPHGQLLAAASPGRPDEQDVPAPLVGGELDRSPVDADEDDVAKPRVYLHGVMPPCGGVGRRRC